MGRRIRVLIVEDRPEDAELLVHELERGGYEPEWTRVETEEDFLAGLDPPPDLVISDYKLPGFSGPRALELFTSTGLDAPFIVVSGAVGEEEVVDLLKRGATDYLLKDRLGRLAPAVGHGLKEMRLQREAVRAELAVRETGERYRRLFENIPSAMSHSRVVFANGKAEDLIYISVNDRWKDLTGLPDPTGRRMTEILTGVRESNPELLDTFGRVALDGEPARFESLVPGIGWLDISVHRSEPEHIVSVFHDISARKQNDAALLESESNKMANEAKTEFLSRMSHELRTPLNAILGFGQLLEMEDLGRQNDASVGQIMTAGRLLLELIEDVLQISRIEAGTLDVSTVPVRVRQGLVSVADLMKPMANKREVTVIVDEEVWPEMCARANERSLRQVLLNLVSNAIKYNVPQGEVVLTAREVDDRVLIEVSDTGVGIASDDLHRVWAPFDRLGAESRGIQGTGLGLAVSKQLVESMGGAITLGSEVGKGSVFTVDLERAAGGSAAETL